MKKFTADFETCTWLENETYVWAWAVCEINDNYKIWIDNTIDSFIEFCYKHSGSIFLFHNLKFDGEFIIYWLLKHDYIHIKDKKEKQSKTFTTLISNKGLFYSITVYFKVDGEKVKEVTLWDSLKILNMSVEEVPKSFGLSINKLELDYDTPRVIGHILTEHEKEYITNDVKITAMALNTLFKENMDKMTSASDALSYFKTTLTKSRFDRLFPKLDYELDTKLRDSYKGGFTYLNPVYKEKDVGCGIVLDVNSLYPSVLYNELMPIGEPIYYEGEYQYDKVYPLYIQVISCSFELKKDKIPTIQIKHSYFIETEYLTSSDGEIITLTLSSVDLALFKDHYDLFDVNYEYGWKFKGMNGIFTKYIDKWINEKIKATLNGNKGMRSLAKLMLNSLYGKFATSMKVQSKIPRLDNDIVKYDLDLEEEKDGLYLPIGIFTTSYARNKTIRTSQAIKDYSIKKYGVDMYIYSDTDSIHTTLPIEEAKKFCDIDNVKLGAWKHEATFTKARFVRQKCYIEKIDDEVKITCAGMPKSCYKYVEWKKFKEGFTCSGKLTFKHVKGGVKLVDTDFTIKSDKKLKKNIKKI